MAKEKSWLIHSFFNHFKLAKTDMGILYPIFPKETVHFAQSSELPQAIHDFAQIILCWKTKILHWRMFRLKQNCFLFLNQITTSPLSSQTISSWLNCWSLVVWVGDLFTAVLATSFARCFPLPLCSTDVMCHRSWVQLRSWTVGELCAVDFMGEQLLRKKQFIGEELNDKWT